MDLEKDVFKQKDPGKIAASVKRSAEKKQAQESQIISVSYEHDQFLREPCRKKFNSGTKEGA